MTIEEKLIRLLRYVASRSERLPLTRFTGMESRLRAFLGTWYEAMVALGFIPNGPGGLDARVQRAIDCLDSLANARTIPYDRLCHECAVSKTHLDRLFKEQLGKTLREYRYTLGGRIDSDDPFL